MKKSISLALYFFLLFVTAPAFSSGTSSADNTYEVCQIGSTEEAHTSLTELMRWCNTLENNDPIQTESGVYELQGDKLLSVNPNESYFLCTQDQIDRNDLSPQDISPCQNQTLYLVIKKEAFAERSASEVPVAAQQTPSSFGSYPSIQPQVTEEKPAESKHSIEDTLDKETRNKETRNNLILIPFFALARLIARLMGVFELPLIVSLAISCLALCFVLYTAYYLSL